MTPKKEFNKITVRYNNSNLECYDIKEYDIWEDYLRIKLLDNSVQYFNKLEIKWFRVWKHDPLSTTKTYLTDDTYDYHS